MARGPNAVLLVLGSGEDEQSLWLEFNIDALVQVEELLDRDAMSIVGSMVRSGRLGLTRAMLWAALRTYHPALDVKAAGELLRRQGNELIRDKILEAFAKAFPTPRQPGDGDPPPEQQAA